MARISTKNQVTIPVAVLEEAHLHPGDALSVEATGDGELRLHRDETDPFRAAFGALTGVYPPGFLKRLDEGERER